MEIILVQFLNFNNLCIPRTIFSHDILLVMTLLILFSNIPFRVFTSVLKIRFVYDFPSMNYLIHC